MDFTDLLVAMSIPSAITGLCFKLVENRIKKRDDWKKKEQDEIEKARKEYELHIIHVVWAVLSLCEATAKAVKELPDTQCNGDMTKALERVKNVKVDQKTFLNKQALDHIYGINK